MPAPQPVDRPPSVLTDLAATGPIEVALVRSVETVPMPASLPGGCVYELKWDGFRGVLRRTKDSAELWSRKGVDLSWRFPDIIAAALTQVPVGTVLDGELCVWLDGRLDWGQLQRRLGSTAQIAERARISPASYVAFDIISAAGVDLRTQPWAARRTLLEQVGADWQPPLQPTPVTLDRDEAEQWARDYRPQGIEGLVIKGTATRYAPGRSSTWLKWKARQSEEVIVGAVTGSFDQPQAVIAGRLTPDRQLVTVGRSTALTPAQAAELASVLTPVDPASHPWPEQITGFFGGPPVTLRHLDPVLVAEISADAALQQGRWRHAIRFVRLRPDLVPADVPPAGRVHTPT